MFFQLAESFGKLLPSLVEFLLDFIAMLVSFRQFFCVPAQLELSHHVSRQNTQGLLLIDGELARDFINHAQSSQCMAVRSYQRRPGVKTNLRIRDHQGVMREAFVLRRIGYDKQVGLADGVAAERDIARGLFHRDADSGLEPLAFFVHECD